MKTYIILACLLITAFIYVGCDSDSLSSATHYRFVNESSVTVSIKPGSGETFQEFTLMPGQTKTLDVGVEDGDRLDYMYGPASQVTVNKINDTTSVFTDPVIT